MTATIFDGRKATIARYGKGELPEAYEPGDIFVVRDWVEDALGLLIQARGRAILGKKLAAKDSDWNVTHSGGIETAEGGIIEAQASGVKRASIEKYRDADLYIITPNATSVQRGLCVERWRACVGMEYDVIGFVGIGQQTLFGDHILISDDHGLICSALCCFGALAYVVTLQAPYQEMAPIQILLDFGLELPEPPYPLNWFARFLDGLVTVGKAISPF